MLCKYGSIISDGRGSVGGSTFSRNRAGAYVRQRVVPVDPSTAKQNVFRSRMSAAVVAWRALTAAQRDTFNAKALITVFSNKLGDSFHPTGAQLFIKGYNLLDAAGLAQVTAPPTSPILEDGSASAEYGAAVGFNLLSTTADWPANAVLLFYRQVNLPNSMYFFKGPYSFSSSAIAGDFVADVLLIAGDGILDGDSAMFASWRLVGDDGAASAMRYGRGYKA